MPLEIAQMAINHNCCVLFKNGLPVSEIWTVTFHVAMLSSYLNQNNTFQCCNKTYDPKSECAKALVYTCFQLTAISIVAVFVL